MQYPLLNTLHDIGTRMVLALEQEDLESFYPLLEERSVLLNRLATAGPPDAPDVAWRTLAEAVREQQTRIAGALDEQERRLSEAVGMVYRTRTARQRYRGQTQQRGFLRSNLHG